MVSGDKHFDIVKCQLNTIYDNIVVNRVETIEEGIMSDNIEALYLPKNRIPVLKLIRGIAN